jgi:hypothetical protein
MQLVPPPTCLLIALLLGHGLASGDESTKPASTNAPPAAPGTAPATNAAATSPVPAKDNLPRLATGELDAEKLIPALVLPEPWTPLTPEQTKSMQLYASSLMKGDMSSVSFSRGFLYGKDGKMNILTSASLVIGIYQHALSPQLFYFGYQKEKQQTLDSVNANMNGIVSDFTWEQPYWNAALRTVVCPISWQNFDGSTSRLRYYFIPTKGYIINFMVIGGGTKPDQIFADAEQAISKVTVPGDVALPPAWGEQIAVLLKPH